MNCKTKMRSIVGVLSILATAGSVTSAHVQEGGYVEPGWDYYPEEPVGGDCFDGIYYDYGFSEKYEWSACVTSPIIYSNGINGGYYIGELTVPSEMYGLGFEDKVFPVVGIQGIYMNGLTALYLPESIEYIGYSIIDCQYLEKVILNNSLKELNGIRDCPALTECPLPLSLERIYDGWMSGIAISETIFPEALKTIGRGVFCNNKDLNSISLGNLEEMGDNCFCNLPMLQEIEIPATLQALGKGCFSNCRSLVKVTLPENPVLTEGCFNHCQDIKEVWLHAEIPCQFPDDCMAQTDKSCCTLYVPEGSETAYSATKGWNEFGRIVAFKKSKVPTVDSLTKEWRAFSSNGSLIIDTPSQQHVRVYELDGQMISDVLTNGRRVISLPKGIYMVISEGRSIKIRI